METIPKGSPVPELIGKDQNGNALSLADFKGQKICLYFYPEDDTPGCTIQGCNLRDNYGMLLSKGIKIIGVSMDDEASHQRFIAKYELPFPLIADIDRQWADAYKVWGEKNLYGNKYMGLHRYTFLINEQGIIEHIIKKVDVNHHSAQILKIWGMEDENVKSNNP